jgi:predicted flap endonuclease-1-like 5' DNA nuclease
MNSSSWSFEPISQDMVLVTVALSLAAILAILTVIGMIVGARSRAKRRAAEAEEQARIEQLLAEGKTATNVEEGTPPLAPAPTPRPTPASTPVAPAPPPASAEVAAGTPPAAPDLADEPIPAAAPLDASPASVAADTPAETAGDDAGDAPLTTLKGLGPKIAARLGELGITRVGQLAWLDDQEAADLDAQLGAFQGRMKRDRWREQARLLASGDRAGFERAFGRLG